MSPAMISLIGLLFALAILIVMSYKGYPLPFVGLLVTVVVYVIETILTPEGPGIVILMKETFMSGFVSFTKGYYLLLLLSTVFAMLMADSGCAEAIATTVVQLTKKFPGRERYAAVFAITLIGFILSAGGVSAFIIVFVCMPIAKSLFEQLDVPWHLFQIYALGVGTFTLSALPGMASVNNIIPTQYLGTTAMAAPMLGIIGSLVIIAFGVVYTLIAVRKTIVDGEGFMKTGARIAAAQFAKEKYAQDVRTWQAFIPPLAVLVVLNILGQAAEVAMLSGCILCYVMFRRNLPDVIRNTVLKASDNAAMVVCTTSIIVGFGAAASSTLGYQLVLAKLNELNLSPIWQIVLTGNIIAGLLGSSAGGVSVTLSQFADQWLATGLNPEVIHRLTAMAAQGLDSLPHASAIVVGYAVCRTTHKDSYKHIFWTNVVATILGAIVAAILASFGVV